MLGRRTRTTGRRPGQQPRGRRQLGAWDVSGANDRATNASGSNLGSWVGGTADAAVFTAGSGAGPFTVNVPGEENIYVGNITFAGPGYTLGTDDTGEDYQNPTRPALQLGHRRDHHEL